MDNKISFECPYCSTYMEAPKDALGRKVQCYKCEEKFELTLLHKVDERKDDMPASCESSQEREEKKKLKVSQGNSKFGCRFFGERRT